MNPEATDAPRGSGSRQEQPASDTRITQSACILDCPDACSLEVEVAGGRVVRIDGSNVNPLTGGYICGKVRGHFIDHLYGPERLLRPAVRKGAKGEAAFEPVSWDVALSRVADKLIEARQQHGGEAILPLSYGGSNGLLSQDTTDARLFRRLGASRLARTVCAAPTTRAAQGLYGKMAGVAFSDYVHAQTIIVWGANPGVSGIHLMPFLQEAKRRGAFLAVVDPRRTEVARLADLHVALRPGTDLPVALSIIRWLFESAAADEEFLHEHATGADELRRRAEPWSFDRAAEVAGIEAEQIGHLACQYAGAKAAVIRCGWGLERNRNGGSAVAAVLALPAVAGKFGVRGGGYTMSNAGAWPLSSDAAACEEETDARVINMNRVGETLLQRDDPAVKLLFVYNCNPLATLPNQNKVRAGLEREDLFTVVFEQVMTDTARYADVLLPATTFLEHTEMARSYGAYVLQKNAPVIGPVGESRPNHEVFAELCRRTGVAGVGDPEHADELADAILQAGNGDGTWSVDMTDSGIAVPEFGAAPIQFVDVLPNTPNQKINLVPEELDREADGSNSDGGLYSFRPDRGASQFPLTLISPATKRTISSTLGQVRKEQVPVEIHPDDAAARAIGPGDRVRVFNELGEVGCLAKVSSAVRRGVAYLPKGIWSHNTLSGNTGNALVPDSLTDLGGGACFNDTRVQIERLDRDLRRRLVFPGDDRDVGLLPVGTARDGSRSGGGLAARMKHPP